MTFTIDQKKYSRSMPFTALIQVVPGNILKCVLASKISQPIANLLKTNSICITIHIMPVQQQLNSADCSVFTVAFDISLLFGKDPVQETYDPSSVTSHLIKRLRNKRFTSFPISASEVERCSKRLGSISLLRVCRIPYFPGDNAVMNWQLLLCTKCGFQFHRGCGNELNNLFKCPSCLQQVVIKIIKCREKNCSFSSPDHLLPSGQHPPKCIKCSTVIDK